jgi:sulfhydrogenase subunit gamma (sulfur reductase)
MQNIYQTKKVKILDIKKETHDVKLFKLALTDKSMQKDFEFIPGQILELSIPNFNEAPFAYCSSPSQKEYFEVCVRKAGELTSKLHKMKKGDVLGVRGPYGNGFPIEKIKKRNTLIIAGGIGLVPFRSLIEYICGNKKQFPAKTQLFYGAREKDDILFVKEYEKWFENIDMHLTLDKGKPEKIKKLYCNIGLITTLFDTIKVLPSSIALVCGPPIMCKFVVQKLKELNFDDKDIYLSLERKMECGVGVCEHCAVGSYYVCKDGPVFSWDQIKDIEGAV